VLLFGSWARGDAHPESDIDLLVVIDGLESAWHELRAMDDVLWRHSLANDTLVTALPVGQDRAGPARARRDRVQALGRSGGVRAPAGQAGRLPEEAARVLRSLFEQRNDADHGGADVSSEQAKIAIVDAGRFVDAAEGWLSQRS
jgi:Nucleotidyltransferase domain